MNIVLLLLQLALALATLQPSVAAQPSASAVLPSAAIPSLSLPDPGVRCACPRFVVASMIWDIALLLLQSCASLEPLFSSACTACPVLDTDALASEWVKVVCCPCPCFVVITVIWQVVVLSTPGWWFGYFVCWWSGFVHWLPCLCCCMLSLPYLVITIWHITFSLLL